MEEKHVQEALKTGQYPQWAIEKVKNQVRKKEPEQKNKKKPTDWTENRGVVTMPYVRQVTERIQRARKKYNINTPVTPLTKLRQILVHPNDNIEDQKKMQYHR